MIASPAVRRIGGHRLDRANHADLEGIGLVREAGADAGEVARAVQEGLIDPL